MSSASASAYLDHEPNGSASIVDDGEQVGQPVRSGREPGRLHNRAAIWPGSPANVVTRANNARARGTTGWR
jgi:hypothetical protein